MVQTFFENEGHKYRLKYHRIVTEDGELYQGILFLENAIGFSYTVDRNKNVSFENKFLDESFQKLIISLIEKKEKQSTTNK